MLVSTHASGVLSGLKFFTTLVHLSFRISPGLMHTHTLTTDSIHTLVYNKLQSDAPMQIRHNFATPEVCGAS